MSAVVAVDLFKEQIWNNKWIKRRKKCVQDAIFHLQFISTYVYIIKSVLYKFELIFPHNITSSIQLWYSPHVELWFNCDVFKTDLRPKWKIIVGFSNGPKWFYGSAYSPTFFNNSVNYQNILLHKLCSCAETALRLLEQSPRLSSVWTRRLMLQTLILVWFFFSLPRSKV